MKPLLVIVSGAPGSGKTELGGKLAAALHLPLISKDVIKEGLMDAQPVRDRQASSELGSVTFRLLYRIAASILDAGTGVMIEAPFTRADSSVELRDLSRRSCALVVHCAVPAALAAARYRSRVRSGARHPGHFDGEVLRTLESRIAAGEYDLPLLDRPTLLVDTADGYRPGLEEIVAWIGDAGRA